MQKFFVALFLLGLIGCNNKNTDTNRIFPKLKDIGSVISLIERDYVEPVEIKSLTHGALRGMMKTLDPYSQYLDEKQYKELKTETYGQFTGIGVDVSVKKGVLYVIAPLDGSPAETAGIKAGDAILKINEESTRDMTLSEAVEKMRGEPGSTVKLTVMREGAALLTDLVIKRETIKIESIRDVKMLEPGVAYIRLAAFQENTIGDLESALRKIKTQNARALILDVRNNSGGLLNSGVRVAAAFIPKGKLIVSTKSRSHKQDEDYYSENEAPFIFKPLLILVNKGSASSSEIVAGAVQDHKLGIVVGAQTFGKGSVQSVVPLPDGSALRLTTSKYYTPNGRLIHEIGIQPDVVVDAEDALGKALEIAKNMEIHHAKI